LINIACRLVHQKYSGVLAHCTGNTKELFLAIRKIRSIFLDLKVKLVFITYHADSIATNQANIFSIELLIGVSGVLLLGRSCIIRIKLLRE